MISTVMRFISIFLSLTLLARAGMVIVPAVSPEEMTIWLKPGATKEISGDAARVTVSEKPPNAWDAMLASPKTTGAVGKGDFLVLNLTVSAPSAGEAEAEVVTYIDPVPEGQPVFGQTKLYPGVKKRTFRRVAVSPGDFAAGELLASVHFGSRTQVIEVSSLSMEVFPKGTPLAELKLDSNDWDGREEDAAWRAEAEARIERIRKAPLTVTVRDAEGKPVAGAEVEISQKRHAWQFGTMVSNQMLGNGEEAVRYRKEVLRRFSAVTVTSYLADWGWRDLERRAQSFAVADWAQVHGLRARGHLLVYPGWTATPPEWFKIPKPDPRENGSLYPGGHRRLQAARDHRVGCGERVPEQRGFHRGDRGDGCGRRMVQDRPRAAAGRKTYLNETAILVNAGRTGAEQAIFENHIETMLEKGAPFDGIGLQGHFGEEFTAPVRMKEILDRFSKYGKDILITEFDMDNDDKQAQADFVRDFYTLCFSHPAVKGIIQWGFLESDMWRPRGHFITKDWKETAPGRVYRELVLGKWMTNESLTAGADGTVSIRAFMGDYEISVSGKGMLPSTLSLPLAADGVSAEVVLVAAP